MLMSGIAKKMLMAKVNGGNAVKLGNTNVYAVLSSTKRGPVEYAKMAAVKGDDTDTSSDIKNVVSMPADSYFQGYMNYEETGDNFANLFSDFSKDRYEEIMEYLQIDKTKRIEEMSEVALKKIKIAVTLSRNSKVYMLDNPFKGMNSTAREPLLRVIFSWALTANTIAISCNMTDEIDQLIDYAVEHEGDLPVISIASKAYSESYA